MPKVSKQWSQDDDYGPVESWHEEVAGHAIEFTCREQPRAPRTSSSARPQRWLSPNSRS
jgi:hypothetical protein